MSKSQFSVPPINTNISTIFERTSSAWRDTEDIEKATMQNVKHQLISLNQCPSLIQLVQKNKLMVAGGIFSVSTGKVTRVDLHECGEQNSE